MDNDTTRRKGMHEKLLDHFEQEEIPILLGTQMIAKGLDYPKVTLVGVLNADTMLNLPDFRANEKTYQLLTQVSGRAGRHELTGEVIFQTYNPTHYAIQLAKENDYQSIIVGPSPSPLERINRQYRFQIKEGISLSGGMRLGSDHHAAYGQILPKALLGMPGRVQRPRIPAAEAQGRRTDPPCHHGRGQ